MAADVLIYLIVNAIRIGLVLFFLSVFLERKRATWLIVLTGAVTWAANSVAYIVIDNIWLNLITNFAGLVFAICVCYKGRFINKFSALMIDITLGIAAENIAFYMFKEYDSEIQVFTNIFSVFIFMIMIIILDRIFKARKSPDISFSSGITLIVITIGLFFVGYVITNMTNFTTIEVALCIIMIINISVLYLYNKMCSQYLIQRENDLYKLQSEMYRQQLDVMSKSAESYRIFRHDIKHHIVILQDYASRGEVENISEYLNGTTTEYLERSATEVITGNEVVNSVLNYYFACIKGIGGIIDYEVVLHEKMAIEDFELNTMLSNLLSNAYEALKKTENPSLKVFIRYNRGVLNLQISNNYIGSIRKKEGKILTVKPESENHGIGLTSIEKIVEKYKGSMEVTTDNNTFMVKIAVCV